jgi:hypothetical protein
MAENLELKKKLNPEEEELQKTFRNLLTSNIKHAKHYGEVKNRYKWHDQIRCRYSTKFLRENKNWLR